MVCEDDLCIKHKEIYNDFVINFNKIKDSDNWDLITLTPYSGYKNIKQNSFMSKNGFVKLRSAQTTTCYIVKKRFIKTLLENYKYSVKKLISGSRYQDYALDQYWKKLYPLHNIYRFHKKFMIQMPGYSDIEGVHLNIGI